MKTAKRSDQYLIHVLEIMGNAIMGGVEKYVQSVAEHLPAHGFKITCVSPYESPMTETLRQQGSQVYVTHMEDSPPWRSIQYLTELVRHQKVDILHAHLPKAQVLAGVVGCLTGTPVVMTVHGMDIPSWELGILHTTGAHLHVVCQMAYAQSLGMGVPEEKVWCIPNGVDLRTFHPQNACTRFREALPVPPDAPVVGFVGRLSIEKGPDIFLQFAQQLHRMRPEVHFVMVGDGPMRAELLESAALAGLDNHLHLLGTWPNMHEVYPVFDVLVQTSRVEGMPFSLLEAMACGLPIAAMNAGGVIELVEVGISGYLSAVGDWAGLANAVARLVDSPELRQQMGSAGRKRVEQHHNLDRSLDQLSKGFRSLISPSLPIGGLKSSQALIPENLDRNGTRGG